MAEGPSNKLRHITNTVCGGMIIVCRILQNEPERSFAKALKKNTLLLNEGICIIHIRECGATQACVL
jgi:hypothetical protein